MLGTLTVLPPETILRVFSFLRNNDLFHVSLLNKQVYSMMMGNASEIILWKSLLEKLWKSKLELCSMESWRSYYKSCLPNKPKIKSVSRNLRKIRKGKEKPRCNILDLSKITMIAIPTALFDCIGLDTLFLEHNKLQIIPPGISNLKNLRRLYLNDNELSSIPSLLSLFKLEVLFLESNKFKEFPNWVFTMPSLRILSLCKNYIRNFPEFYQNVSSLEGLYVDNNQLEELPDLNRFPKLEILSASNNQIKKVPDSLLNLPYVKKLFLDHNQLESFPMGNISKLKDLKVLFLNNNCLNDQMLASSPLKVKKFKTGNQIGTMTL